MQTRKLSGKLLSCKARLERHYKQIWHHEEHKPLIGAIKGFGEFIHDRYGLQKTIIVERENGEVVSAFMNAYIANGMERSHAQPGDRVLIQLLGKAKSQDGNQFNQFQVYVEKANY